MINTHHSPYGHLFRFHASVGGIYLGSWICERHMRVTNSINTPFIALVPMIDPFHVWPAIYSPSKSPVPRSYLVFLHTILIGSTTSMLTHSLGVTLSSLGFMLYSCLQTNIWPFSLFFSVLWPILTDSDCIDGGQQVAVLLVARRHFYCWMHTFHWRATLSGKKRIQFGLYLFERYTYVPHLSLSLKGVYWYIKGT